jgi:3-oxoacyl-[acyl-carrier protein] reductase
MRLSGKVAIITGAGSGIGRESALLFAKEGAKVIVADVNSRNSEETVSIVKSFGGEATALSVDVSVSSDVENMIGTSLNIFGKIDILYNNAGIHLSLGGVKVEDINESSWERIFAVNVKGAFLTVRQVVPIMKKMGGGVILNTSSDVAIRPIPYSSAYIASKGAIISFSKCMAIELAEYNIRVNCISPGATETPTLFSGGTIPVGLSREEALKNRGSTIPLGRVNKPIDVAYAALYLVSDESSTLTGVNLNVDGGRGI